MVGLTFRPRRHGAVSSHNTTPATRRPQWRLGARVWPPFGFGEIRKGDPNEDYGTRCRCDHAASSSERFQSRASAASLSNADSAVSPFGSSSKMVTSARRVWPG